MLTLKCQELVERTGIDTLAPALGSVHGPYKGEPKLGFKEMEEIGASTGFTISFTWWYWYPN